MKFFVGFGLLLALVLVSIVLINQPKAIASTSSPTIPDNSKKLKDFWAKGYKARWVSQTQATEWEKNPENGMSIQDGDEFYDVYGGNEVVVKASFKNTGSETWYNAPDDRQVCINIYKDRAVKSSWTGKEVIGESDFYSSTWLKPYRIGCLEEQEVEPGDTGTFTLNFTIPRDAQSGRFREDITLASGSYWMESDKDTSDPIGASHIWVGFDIFGYFEKATVQRVVDGDTVVLADGRKVRYVGIDTPETVDPDKPVQCYGKEASNRNKTLLEGKEIVMVGDPTSDNIDKYDRLLRYIYIPEYVQSVNYELVRDGYAYAYTKYPNHLMKLFVAIESEAKSASKGLWGACDVVVSPTPITISTPVDGYSCSNASAKYCTTTITSCAEAKYLFQTCGLTRLDGDKDGVPCNNLCS